MYDKRHQILFAVQREANGCEQISSSDGYNEYFFLQVTEQPLSLSSAILLTWYSPALYWLWTRSFFSGETLVTIDCLTLDV